MVKKTTTHFIGLSMSSLLKSLVYHVHSWEFPTHYPLLDSVSSLSVSSLSFMKCSVGCKFCFSNWRKLVSLPLSSSGFRDWHVVFAPTGACWEATVTTGHGTMDWFKIGKGVYQGCILPPCLFNFYAEYIMKNAGLEESQAGVKIAREISITSDMQMIPL